MPNCLLHILAGPGNEVTPLVLTIDSFENGYDIPEHAGVRSELDALLAAKGKARSMTSPSRFSRSGSGRWRRATAPRSSNNYKWAYPFFRKRNRQANGRGLYFERLMMYGSGPCDGKPTGVDFESVLRGRPGVRRSMFQATTFDPARDHTASA